MGAAGDFIGVAVYFGVFHVYTRDGLYVAMLFKDSRTSGGLGPEVNACETFTGQIVKPKGTDRYFLLNGDQDGRVSEILGIDAIKRLAGGKYAHSAEDAKKAADALAEYERLKARGQRRDVVRGKSLISTCKGIAKFVDSERNFTARTAYDERNLYVAVDVTSKSELLNAANDPRLIFKGGNCIGIQLAADPNADPKRKTPAPGDVRILVTRRGGQPAAAIYRPKAKGFSGEPIILASPANKEPFDSIEQTDKIGRSGGGSSAVWPLPHVTGQQSLRSSTFTVGHDGPALAALRVCGDHHPQSVLSIAGRTRSPALTSAVSSTGSAME